MRIFVSLDPSPPPCLVVQGHYMESVLRMRPKNRGPVTAGVAR